MKIVRKIQLSSLPEYAKRREPEINGCQHRLSTLYPVWRWTVEILLLHPGYFTIAFTTADDVMRLGHPSVLSHPCTSYTKPPTVNFQLQVTCFSLFAVVLSCSQVAMLRWRELLPFLTASACCGGITAWKQSRFQLASAGIPQVCEERRHLHYFTGMAFLLCIHLYLSIFKVDEFLVSKCHWLLRP